MGHGSRVKGQVRRINWLGIAAVIMLCFVALYAVGCSMEKGSAKVGKDIYYCPMHPTYTSDKPGDCPICNMKLVKKQSPGEASHSKKEIASSSRQGGAPRNDAPPMVKGLPAEAKGESALAKAGTVQITPEKQQLIGIKKEAVSRRPLTQVVRTVGKVKYDETKLYFINAKFAGWIEELFVDYTGKDVKKGDALLSIYSPDLVSTQQEYLTAIKSAEIMKGSPIAETKEGAEGLVEASKKRLLFWDISEDDIKELEKTGAPKKTLTLRAPVSGVVIEKEALKGKYLMPGENLYKIADLSSVWIEADIYEYEFPLIKLNQDAEVSLSYLPGEAFKAKATFISPTLDPTTRTAKVRFEFENKDMKFKPDMFANVSIAVDLGDKLAISKEAVLDSGLRQIAFVDKGDGYFEPRELRLGVRAEGYVEVLDGLSEGETVVTSGNFLVDSESKLKSAIGGAEHQH